MMMSAQQTTTRSSYIVVKTSKGEYTYMSCPTGSEAEYCNSYNVDLIEICNTAAKANRSANAWNDQVNAKKQ